MNSKKDMPNHTRFYIGVALCVLGWVFIGLGIVIFMLSLLFLMRSNYRVELLSLFMIIDIAGFSLSLYFDSQFIAQYIF